MHRASDYWDKLTKEKGETELGELAQHVLFEGEKTARVDAIVWLQGGGLTCEPKVVELWRAGVAPHIVVSGNNSERVEKENDCYLSELENSLVGSGVPSSRIELEIMSMNTREQATNVLGLVERRNWKSIALVARSFHQPRVYLSFLQELANRGLLNTVRLKSAPAVYCYCPPYRMNPKCADLMESLVAQEYERIRLYQAKGDIASEREALTYISRWANQN